MKHLKTVGLAALSMAAFAAFAASTASATTFEVGGVIRNEAIAFEAEATQGTVLAKTNGEEANTCTGVVA